MIVRPRVVGMDMSVFLDRVILLRLSYQDGDGERDASIEKLRGCSAAQGRRVFGTRSSCSTVPCLG